MSESLPISQETIESYESVGLCPLCLGEHKMSNCPQMCVALLRSKLARKPGLSPAAIWAAFWCCVVVVLVGSGLWRWLY